MSLTTNYGENTNTLHNNYNQDENVNTHGSVYWKSITMSSDGKYLAVIGSNGGRIFISSNYGYTWTPTDTPDSNWVSITSSDSGQYLAAVVNPGKIYTSSDYGNNWTSDNDSLDVAWTCISSSSTGQYLVASRNNCIYISNDYGNSWVFFDLSDPFGGEWSSVLMAKDGSSITLTVYGGGIYVHSTDFSLLPSEAPDNNWISIASSANGVYVIAAVDGGGIYTSIDYGRIFTQNTEGLPENLLWKTVASSYSGQYLSAVASASDVQPGGIYISKNYGESWELIPSSDTQNWSGIASSGSGQFLAATVMYSESMNTMGDIYTYVGNNYSYSYTPIKITKTFEFTYSSDIYPGSYYLYDALLNKLSIKIVDTRQQTITFTDIMSDKLTYGTNTFYIYKAGDDGEENIQISDPMLVNATCFLEGTKILTINSKNQVKYIPIENLKPGMRVKTLSSGFIPIKYIGYSTIYNPGLKTRVRDQLFKCSKSAYPELIDDLILTGNHSILVGTISDKERSNIIDTLGKIYITEKKYRLPAFNDSRAVPYELQGEFRIWNLALENDNYYANYGIYANGLLVETTSCRYLKEISGMTLLNQ